MRIRIAAWYVRLIQWTLVCGLSAAPSFVFGAMAFPELGHIVAMLLGVATYIAGYTWITGTRWALRLRRRPFVNRTLRIGYSTRLALSAASWIPPLAILDMWCGMMSIMIVTGDDRGTPIQVYAITLVQGMILNVILLIYMALVWSVQTMFLPAPAPLDDGMCTECGYDLRASAGACPECGTAIDAETAVYIAARAGSMEAGAGR